MKSAANKIFRWLLPFIFMGITGAGYFLLKSLESGPEALPAKIKTPPSVNIYPVKFYDKPLELKLTGTVSPLYKTEISSELTGRVVYVSEKLVKGGFFKKGEEILRIDDRDYKDALIQSKAELSKVNLEVIKEKELAKQAFEDWKELGEGTPTDLALRKPQIKQALSSLDAAKSKVEKAARDLEKTSIKAPFSCMVSSKSVSVGTFVNAGSSLFEIFNIDTAEIRLAMSPDNARFIDLPRPGVLLSKTRKVEVSAYSSGTVLKREGYISRIEGETDPETRFQYLVVRIDDPYSIESSNPVIKIGDFADVKVLGKKIENSVFIPESALLNDNRIMKVDNTNKILFEKVNVLKRSKDKVLVSGNLLENDKIIVSRLEFPVEGTIVRINGEENE